MLQVNNCADSKKIEKIRLELKQLTSIKRGHYCNQKLKLGALNAIDIGLHVKEVATLINVHPVTLNKWRRAKKAMDQKIPRILPVINSSIPSASSVENNNEIKCPQLEIILNGIKITISATSLNMGVLE